MSIEFVKMHGLGNDFVIVDDREGTAQLSKERIASAADRQRGVGCDQFIVLEPSNNGADVFMRIYNPDGGEAGACGNATRCVADIIRKEKGADQVKIETISGVLDCMANDDLITVDMGPAKLNWDEIPLAEEMDTLELPIEAVSHVRPCAVNMGNPHAVYFVEKLNDIKVEELGPYVETDPLFPEKANVEFAEITAPGQIRMRVWERGAGITQACGSGACATLVAAVRRGLSDRVADVVLDGGTLTIEWREEDGHVLMTGPYTYVYKGVLFDDFSDT